MPTKKKKNSANKKKNGNFKHPKIGPKTSNQWDRDRSLLLDVSFFFWPLLSFCGSCGPKAFHLWGSFLDPMGEADLNLVTWLEEICWAPKYKKTLKRIMKYEINYLFSWSNDILHMVFGRQVLHFGKYQYCYRNCRSKVLRGVFYDRDIQNQP